MRVIVKLDGSDITNRVLLSETKISKAISNRYGNASVTLRATAAESSMYDEARYDINRYDASVATEYVNKVLTIEDYSTNGVFYKGTIVEASVSEINESNHLYALTLKEYSTVLSEIIIDSKSYTNKNNKYIIEDLITTYLAGVSTTNVVSLATLSSYDIKDKTLREVLEDLAKLTNAYYWLTPSNELYFASILYAPSASYKLTDDKLDVGYCAASIKDFKKDANNFANRVTVLGGVDVDNNEVRSVVNDLASQSAIGKVIEKKIVDRNIVVQSIADLLADAELSSRSEIKVFGSFETSQTGFDIGQALTVALGKYSVNTSVIITGIEYSWYDFDKIRFKVTFGPKPTIVDVLQNIKNPVSTESSLQKPYIPPGSISSDQIASVTASKISGSITSSQIGSVNATAIQGSVTASQIGSVNATVIQGVVVSTQLADEIIDSLTKIAPSLRQIPISTSAPTLPSANYPANSFYYNSTDGYIYKNNSGAWQAVTENEAITGKLTYYNLGTIKADKIIGMIAAAQIGSVNASAITGTISAAQIGSVNASAITGTISAAQIGSVSAASITGNISAAQIGSVSASTITGSITSSQITSIDATKISGSIQDTQIASISVGKISGTIQDSQIAGISATKITGTISGNQIGSINTTQLSGTISDSQIGSISASKITGTISATQIGSVNASSISGNITANQIGSVNASDISISPTEKISTIYCSGNIHADGVLYGTEVNCSGNVNGTNGHFSAVSIGANTVQGAAFLQVGTIAGTVAAGDHSHTFSTSWSQVSDKPNTFAPSSHTHSHSHGVSVSLSTTTDYYNIQDYNGAWHYGTYVTGVSVVSASTDTDSTNN